MILILDKLSKLTLTSYLSQTSRAGLAGIVYSGLSRAWGRRTSGEGVMDCFGCPAYLGIWPLGASQRHDTSSGWTSRCADTITWGCQYTSIVEASPGFCSTRARCSVKTWVGTR
ncbi:hypothetical protein MN608_04850 [Microdochium nivale]|nr:hypothetical protein MN608_04850 [Microdochium nivale]